MGDIGDHFPDTDPRYLNIYSIDLLTAVYRRVGIVALSWSTWMPPCLPRRPICRRTKRGWTMRMAGCMSVNQQVINIKATTTEGLGAIGHGDGIAAMCVVLLIQSSNA
jgi:2-C-methyl-D-erythritol 2,4-cyclodiphosphate synthase